MAESENDGPARLALADALLNQEIEDLSRTSIDNAEHLPTEQEFVTSVVNSRTGKEYKLVSLDQYKRYRAIHTTELDRLSRVFQESGMFSEIFPSVSGKKSREKVDFDFLMGYLKSILSPLLPSDRDIKAKLVEAGFSEAEAKQFVTEVKEQCRAFFKLQGPKITVDKSREILKTVCSSAFNFARIRGWIEEDKENVKFIEEYSSPELSKWERDRRSKLPGKVAPYSAGKLAGENALDYYRRVWLPFKEAGILYRDDIPRLGGGDLIKTVSIYCTRHNLDPESILPPPATQRDLDELASLAPESRDAAFLRAKIANRESTARSRASRRNRTP